MSMEINGMYNQYQTDHADRLKAGREKAKETEKGQNDGKALGKVPVPHDAYISGEKQGADPGGPYRVGQDENGNRKVFFDDPKKSGNADDNRRLKVKSDDPGKPDEKCTGSTDKVDREIKRLKEKKKELEQQIRSASGDEEKVRELKNELAQVERELGQKDNDTYRRQHSTFRHTKI